MAAANQTAKNVNDLLRDRARARGAQPPTPQPIVGKGRAIARSDAEIEIAWYKWCQDIISDSMQFQMETRPQQAAAVGDPNAKPGEAA